VVDKDRKKISLKMLIETEKHGDLFLFNNEFSLKVNDNFILNFEEFSLPVTITSIEEPKDK
jgi:hypothetical protein